MKPPFPFLRLLPSSSNPFLSLLRLCRPPPPTSAALSSHFSLPPRHILSPLTLSAMSSSPPLDDAIRADSSSPPAAVEKRAEEISADERRDEELKAVKEEREKRSEYMVEFAVSDKCKLKIDKGDITKWFVDGSSDAIVNAANERMLGGSGVDGAIHRAAGPRLREACYEVPEVYPGVRCPTGEARITPGFRLRASHVIHTVGPVYDEEEDPEALLKSAYRNSLSVAKEHNIQYVAFPAISCGVYGYPYDEAASIAISTIKEFANDFKEVHFVLFLDDIYGVWLEKAEEILGSDGSIAKENAESDGSVAKEIAGNDGSTLKKTSGTNGSVAKNVAGSDGSVVKDVVGSNESVTKDVAGKEGSAAEIVGNEGSVSST